MRKLYSKVLLFLIISSLPVSLFAMALTNWYVSPSGNDGNPGTYDEPFLSIQTAIDRAFPLDTIIVAAGEYNENISIGKPVDIEGPNANINPNTWFGGSRTDEATINGTVQIASDYVTINGMQIQNGTPLAMNTTDSINNLYLRFNRITGFNEVFSFNYDSSLHNGITVSNWTCEGNYIGDMNTEGGEDPIMSLGGLQNAYFADNTFSGGRMGALQFTRASSLMMNNNYFQNNNQKTGFVCFFDGENNEISFTNSISDSNSSGLIFYCSDDSCLHKNIRIENNNFNSLQDPGETSSGYRMEPMIALVSLTDATTVPQAQFENFYVANNYFEQDFSSYTSYEDPLRLVLVQGYTDNVVFVNNTFCCKGTLSNATAEVFRLKDVKGDVSLFCNNFEASDVSYDGDSYLQGVRASGGAKSGLYTSQALIGNYFYSFNAAVRVNGPLPGNDFFRVVNNSFNGNTMAVLNEDMSYNVDARGNYWNASDGPVPAGSGDPVSPMVVYTPFSATDIECNSDYVTSDYSNVDFGTLNIDFSNGTTGTGGFIAMAKSATRIMPNAISRYWIVGDGMSDFLCDLTFYYDSSDLPDGVSEDELVPFYSVDGSTMTPITEGITRDTFNHTLTVSGINHFSLWTLGKVNVVPVELSDFMTE
jgi:hypothetical protein